jgi:DNA-binding NarL/FixJ family response regulator
MMPDVNGLELLERMQRETPWLLARIIVMTGAHQTLVDAAVTLPVRGVMRKPFEIEELLEAATSCAEGRARESGQTLPGAVP